MSVKKSFRKDVLQTRSLVKAGKVSATNALRASRALGLTVSFIEKGVIYEELPDGSKKVIEKIKKTTEAPFVLSKGMVLHAK
ncbi:hypothetical protein D3C85_1041030 [compost metagenome]